MATKSRATRGGEYVCKVGNFDIRHKITQPRKTKNLKGETQIQHGSVEASVYEGRKLLKGGFNDHTKAIQYAWNRIKSSKLEYIVSKKAISKYNLV